MFSSLNKTEFRKIWKRWDAQLLLTLSLFPLLVALYCRFGSWLPLFSSKHMNADDYIRILTSFQGMIFMPIIICICIASVSFRQEFENKQIYYYKDMNRSYILKAKYFSVYSIYFIYVTVYAVLSIVLYFLLFGRSSSGGILPTDPESLQGLVYQVCQTILGMIFYIHLGITFSLRLPSVTSVFAAISCYLFSLSAPYLDKLKYLFPMGYLDMLDFSAHSFSISLALSVFVWLMYNMTMYVANQRCFDRMEFN